MIRQSQSPPRSRRVSAPNSSSPATIWGAGLRTEQRGLSCRALASADRPPTVCAAKPALDEAPLVSAFPQMVPERRFGRLFRNILICLVALGATADFRGFAHGPAVGIVEKSKSSPSIFPKSIFISDFAINKDRICAGHYAVQLGDVGDIAQICVMNRASSRSYYCLRSFYIWRFMWQELIVGFFHEHMTGDYDVISWCLPAIIQEQPYFWGCGGVMQMGGRPFVLWQCRGGDVCNIDRGHKDISPEFSYLGLPHLIDGLVEPTRLPPKNGYLNAGDERQDDGDPEHPPIGRIVLGPAAALFGAWLLVGIDIDDHRRRRWITITGAILLGLGLGLCCILGVAPTWGWPI